MDELIEKGVVVDSIICDPPYGTTACKWDSVIPFNEMWQRLNKLIKPNGAIVLFGSEPFSSALRMSNIKNFKYDWIWEKSQSRGHLNAYNRPMVKHELISVFNVKSYNYQLTDKPLKNIRPHSKSGKTESLGKYNDCQKRNRRIPLDKKLPESILKFTNAQKTVHPTQKPIALMEYLIRTYTNENELVLDFTMGSGTTGVACKNLNRDFIGIEKVDEYFEIAEKRINESNLFTGDI
ncbi:MAG: site-specific DNA-methyltransferase [Colwellia sp.]|nr:site-specific DNA-methyltransferase [Colwellia sp.]